MNLKPATDLVKTFEGFRSKPYLCPAGVPTIGYGSTYYSDTHKVSLQDLPIPEPVAYLLLLKELNSNYKAVMRLCPDLRDEGTINALCDFVYNLGAGRLQVSTLRKRINAQDWAGAKKEILKWNKGGGKILKGLTLRRMAECLLMRS